MELKGKCAIVTGSTGALGGEMVKALAEAGCGCVCHYYRNEKKARELVGYIESKSGGATAVGADLTKDGQAELLVEKAKRVGEPAVLINSAAVFGRMPLAEVSIEQARRVLDLNLTACIVMSKVFAETIKKSGGAAGGPAGKIINVSDVAAIRPWAGYSVYCASKAGLAGATKSLAKELAPDILVNALAPGFMNRPGEMTAEEKKRQLSFIPMRRFAETKEIAAAMIFLLENDYITGQVLNVCGGRAI